MLIYILKVTICWLGFFLIYSALLKKETFFKFNRLYLLGTLVLGAGIPLLEFLPIFQEDNPAVVYFQPINESFTFVQTAVSEVVWESGFDWMQLFWGVYFVGVAIFGMRFFIGLRKIYELYRSSEIFPKENHTLVVTNQTHLPFTFFNLLFWSKTLEVNDADGQKIVMHEEAHVKGWHSIDVLLCEVMSIIFWLSPMVYFYKKSLKTVHEYLADAVVLQTTPTKKYGHLLLQQSKSGLQVALANHFIQSQLKQRIIMMTRNKSRKQAAMKYLFALPVILLLIVIFSKKEAQANTDFSNTELAEVRNYENLNSINEFESFIKNDVDEMPIFPGCENENSKEKVRNCTNTKLLTHIYTNIKYPAEARKAGIQGKVIIKYIVKSDGTISNVRVEKEIGGGCEAAALKVINSLPKMIPAMKDGKAVGVEMTLPVMFKLEGAEPSSDKGSKDDVTVVGMAPQKKEVDPGLQKHLKKDNVKILIDGKSATTTEVEALDPEQITNVDIRKVMKTGNDKEEAYNLILIQTVNAPAVAEAPSERIIDRGKVSYFINGKKATKEKINAIPADQIISERKVETILTENGIKEKVHLIYVTTKMMKGDDTVYQTVDEMPRFSGCEGQPDPFIRKKCAETEMLKYIYSNIRYPAEAREAGIEGRVVVQFVIQEDGSIADAKVVRNLGGGCGEEAKRVIESMPDFIPGKEKGEIVKVKFTMPIAFKLRGGEKGKSPKKAKDLLSKNEKKPLVVVDGFIIAHEQLEKIDVKTIENMTVLKGDKAFDKYGDAGENGVVEVTLKKEKDDIGNPQINPVEAKGKMKAAGLTAVKISPNPTSGVINIDYDGNADPMVITGYDKFGTVLFQKNVDGGKGTLRDIKVNIPAGQTVFLAFKKNGKLYTEMVIVQ